MAIVMYVRRWATERFEQLRALFAGKGVRVEWDRRLEGRRSRVDPVTSDRRRRERRRPPSEQWENLDFVSTPDADRAVQKKADRNAEKD